MWPRHLSQFSVRKIRQDWLSQLCKRVKKKKKKKKNSPKIFNLIKEWASPATSLLHSQFLSTDVVVFTAHMINYHIVNIYRCCFIM